MARILVIDDEPGICRAFEQFLSERGHEVRVSSRGETAIRLSEAFGPDLAIVDVRLPGMSGLELLVKLREKDASLPVIVVTAYGAMETAVEAMRRGAYDYLLKPLELARIQTVIDRALESRKIAADVALGGARAPGVGIAPGVRLLGKTLVMQEVFKRIGAVSTSDVPVLVTGESGTGKEMVARAIHAASARAAGPFEAVNCAAVGEAELKGEIFGCLGLEGVLRPGRTERAAGGTLFLDEVAGLPASVQVHLLRLVESRQLTGPDGVSRLNADVRVISATAADLPGEIEAGRFREDLYYRLNVIGIRMPPLRDRVQDIPILAAAFLSARAGEKARISKSALRRMLEHPWPGNVRELRNAVEHALVLARGETILPEHLPEHVRAGAEHRPEDDGERIRAIVDAMLEVGIPEGEVYQAVMDRFEAPLIAAVLERTGGNQVQAAKLLGIHRTTLRSKIQRHGSPSES